MKRETAHLASCRLELYLNDSIPAVPLVFVIPGGGYAYCNEAEGECIALAFVDCGFSAAVLHYSCGRGMEVFDELSCACTWIRENATFSALFLCGFSAGGHLAAGGVVLRGLEASGVILCYPALLSSGEFANSITFDNLCGDDAALRASVDIVSKVHPGLPPFFIWHTFSDERVPLENSMLFASALRRCGVPFDLHVFEKGPHALSLAQGFAAGAWLELCAAWIRDSLRNVKGDSL